MIELTVRLRGPEGCPWDRAQDYDSLKSLMLEEAYEVIDAVNTRDFAGLEDELGDLLFMIVFYSRLAEEQGYFDVDGVVDHVHAKLIRRHPHVFGQTHAGNAGEALQSWMAVKQKERAAAGKQARESLLDGIPKSLPSTMVAHEFVCLRRERGIRVDESRRPAEKDRRGNPRVAPRTGYRTSQPVGARGRRSRRSPFAAANLSRFLRFDAETCLRRANQKFQRRFQAMEAGLTQRGKTFKECSLDEMESMWEEVKSQEADDYPLNT